MSQWAHIDAYFRRGGISKMPSAENIRKELTERQTGAPTGSEDGPDVRELDHGVIWVTGSLRDVSDLENAAEILAWFVRHARWSERAEIQFEFDEGPRYRYEWNKDGLVKLRGVLDK